jgi:hypothetical protein
MREAFTKIIVQKDQFASVIYTSPQPCQCVCFSDYISLCVIEINELDIASDSVMDEAYLCQGRLHSKLFRGFECLLRPKVTRFSYIS